MYIYIILNYVKCTLNVQLNTKCSDPSSNVKPPHWSRDHCLRYLRGSVLDKRTLFKPLMGKVGVPECKRLWTHHCLIYLHFWTLNIYTVLGQLMGSFLGLVSDCLLLSVCIYILVFGKSFAPVFNYFQPHMFKTMLTRVYSMNFILYIPCSCHDVHYCSCPLPCSFTNLFVPYAIISVYTDNDAGKHQNNIVHQSITITIASCTLHKEIIQHSLLITSFS